MIADTSEFKNELEPKTFIPILPSHLEEFGNTKRKDSNLAAPIFHKNHIVFNHVSHGQARSLVQGEPGVHESSESYE